MEKQRVPSPWGTTFCDSLSFSGPGRWIYISGQIGADQDGKLVNSSFAAEAEFNSRLACQIAMREEFDGLTVRMPQGQH